MHNESAFAKLCYFGAKSRFNVVSPRKENPMPTEYFIIDLFSRVDDKMGDTTLNRDFAPK